MRVLRIKWKDAASIDNWIYAKDFENELATIESIGFLSKENDEAYWLSGTANFDDKDNDSFACTIVIPKKMVIELEDLTLND